LNLNFSEISEHNGPEDSPGYLLWKASTIWRRGIESALKPLGLTHPQFVVLAAVGWLTSSKQVEIASFCGLDPNTTSQIVRSLETKKLIKRAAEDGRSKSTSLTPLGVKLLRKALPIVEQEDKRFFNKINIKASFLQALGDLAII